MFSRRIALSCASIVVLGLTSATAFAADPSVVVKRSAPTAAPTLRELLAAKPVEPTLKRTRVTNQAAVAGPSVSSPAFEPTSEPVAAAGGATVELPAPTGVDTQSKGTSGKPFTTPRLARRRGAVLSVPRGRQALLHRRGDRGGFICSASIINKRILVTAGHCVYDAKNKRFQQELQIRAGVQRDADDPALRHLDPDLHHHHVPVGERWRHGSERLGLRRDGDRRSGAQRVDQDHRRLPRGYLGWRTNSLAGQNISALGYPATWTAAGG